MISKGLICLAFFSVSFAEEENGLTNPSYIRDVLTKEAHWGSMHGAHHENLGAGMFYYGIVYATKAARCVCLGSGDGFVPRVMKQAQRDLHLEEGETILVDGNTGRWGRPEWLGKGSFFKTTFPDIQIILDTTVGAAKKWPEECLINYLHIDADRTIQGAFQDFISYLPFMAKGSFITLHDTGPKHPCAQVIPLIKEMGYDVINFESLGAGVALICIP